MRLLLLLLLLLLHLWWCLLVHHLRSSLTSAHVLIWLIAASHHLLLLLLLHDHIWIVNLRSESHVDHLVIDHVNIGRHLLLLHHLLLAWRHHHTGLTVSWRSLIHDMLLLLRHLEVLIVLRLLLRWKALLHRLHLHHVLLLLLLVLHVHLLLIVLILICERLVEILKIEFVLLEISHPY